MSKEQLNIRLTPEAKRLLKLLAARMGLSEGQTIEQLIKAKAKREKIV